MNASRHLLLVLAITIAGAASAQTLYKLIDKNGKVTYSEKAPPKDYDGKVVPMNIDTKTNSATLKRGSGEGAAQQGNQAYQPTEFEQQMIERGNKRKAAEKRVDDAKKALEQARAALEEAKANPGEGDLNWQSSVKESRPGPTPPPKPPGSGPTPPPVAGGAPQGGYGIGPGRNRTGAHPVPSEDYARRLAALEKDVVNAEKELADAERELRNL